MTDLRARALAAAAEGPEAAESLARELLDSEEFRREVSIGEAGEILGLLTRDSAEEPVN